MSKYSNWYQNIINKANNESRQKKRGTYYESHHIVPKCLGGNDDPLNLVLLTAREHFICHFLLTKIHDDPKLVFALNRMCHDHKGRYINSHLYEIARKAFGKAITDFHKARFAIDPNLTQTISAPLRNLSPEIRRIRAQRSAESQRGKQLSKHTKKAISETLKGRPNHTLRGIPKTKDHKQKLADAKRGKKGNNRQSWEITDTNGNTTITNDRKEYCESHGLNFESVKSMTQKSPHYKGYVFVKKLPDVIN